MEGQGLTLLLPQTVAAAAVGVEAARVLQHMQVMPSSEVDGTQVTEPEPSKT